MTKAPIAHVLSLRKGKELYVVRYTDGQVFDVLQRLACWALNPELSFGFRDHNACAEKIRERTKQGQGAA